MTTVSFEYRPSLAAFIDILGFQELLGTSSAKEVHEHLVRLQRFTAPEDYDLLAEADISVVNWFQVSDAAVRLRHYDTKYHDGALYYELSDLGVAQAELAAKGVFIRGGLAAGNASSGPEGKGPAFGPAIAEAYRTESTVAIYPRICLSQSVIDTYASDDRLKADHHLPKHDEEYVRSMIRSSRSGPWIDYMKIMAETVDDQLDHLRFCTDHGAAIQEQLTKHANNRRVLEKYLWLAAYHNDHVAPYTEDSDGAIARVWEVEYEIDGVAAFRESIIEAPFGWTLPDIGSF